MTRPLLIFSLLILSSIAGCDKIPQGLYAEDDQKVITHRAKKIDFSTFKTYTIVDTVNFVSENSRISFLRYNQNILNEVRNNMNSRGFKEISVNPGHGTGIEPDLIVNVTVIDIEYNVNLWYGWGGYYGFPGYWINSRHMYPYYPPFGYDYGYEKGTLVIEIGEYETLDLIQERVQFIWDGAIRGIITKSNSSLKEDLKKEIAVAFEESPYLKAN